MMSKREPKRRKREDDKTLVIDDKHHHTESTLEGSVVDQHGLKIILITANVGSVFDKPGQIETTILATVSAKISMMVKEHKPKFLALHLQECPRLPAEFKQLMSMLRGLSALRDFPGIYSFSDADVGDDPEFSALGCVYFVHKDIKSIARYDYVKEEFQMPQSPTAVACVNNSCFHKKTKFSVGQFNWKQMSRKGFVQAGFKIGDQEFQLVNVHFFADISNLESAKKTPSQYSQSRRAATSFMIEQTQYTNGFGTANITSKTKTKKLQKRKNSDNNIQTTPKKLASFYFGDFNFRLSLAELIPHLCDGVRPRRAPGEPVSRFYSKDTKKLLLTVEKKRWEPMDSQYPYRDRSTLMAMDWETSQFTDLHEFSIRFPPTYPFDVAEPHCPLRFSMKRPPAWCDRVLLSEAALSLAEKGNPIYTSLGEQDLVGDHKPVCLVFSL
eukprot:m.10742 g.10742  ORF g.10742 m.10742 type:complete len:441 (+) comp8458_c0_seq2:432-1754(+)